jgi:hypothetical protein
MSDAELLACATSVLEGVEEFPRDPAIQQVFALVSIAASNLILARKALKSPSE